MFDNVRVEDLSVPTLQPPGITSQPLSQTASAGTNVTFTVGATGSNPLSYQWRLGGSNIIGGTLTIASTAGTGTRVTCAFPMAVERSG